MNIQKLQQLRQWRDTQARKEGVELYRVLGNETLEEIIRNDARTEEELLEVKGIKEKKLAKYGREILIVMNEEDNALTTPDSDGGATKEAAYLVFSISAFLDLVNTGLRTFEVKLQGEVTSLDERGNVYYFGLKDKEDGSTLSCLIWKNEYRLAGITLVPGMEVIVHGFPNVYKPSGRLSFRADTIELVGEGALKQQYEALKKKLADEGLFAPDRKKAIPLFPERIGLITSRQGEAIFDFRTNLGKFGFQLKFIDARVEGAQAVASLLEAVRQFKHQDIDVLVLVRGGGSLESLLSFNNEMLVREIATFPKPVVSGIGHEQDVSLVDLVADRSCSTPTGAAKLLSYGWEQALARTKLYEKDILSRYRQELAGRWEILDRTAHVIRQRFGRIFESFRQSASALERILSRIGSLIGQTTKEIKQMEKNIPQAFRRQLVRLTERLDTAEHSLRLHNPRRQLALGYSIVTVAGRVVKNVSQISLMDELTVQLQDGEITSAVKKVKKY